METIILESPWTFLTTERTIDFEAGTHSVDAEVHAAALAAGVAYYLSGTPGGVRPVADNTTGDYPVVLGMAKSTSVLSVHIVEAGVAI